MSIMDMNFSKTLFYLSLIKHSQILKTGHKKLKTENYIAFNNFSNSVCAVKTSIIALI